MKELSIEQKAEAYDRAIAYARLLLKTIGNATLGNLVLKNEFKKMFPVLEENEDEKIRKEILTAFSYGHDNSDIYGHGITYGQVRAWLEKQGKKDEEILVLKDQIESLHAARKAMKETYKIELKKQCEQKLADKVEPKFKVGDWIITPENKVLQITSIEGTTYRFNNVSYYWEICCCDEKCRLWTIQDAKDGDVLYMDNGLSTCTFIYKSIDNVIIQKYASYNKFGFEGTTYLVLNDGYVCPATKEQRDLLFQKMKEAGYEWDAVKKELKKIEQKPAEWSKEDEEILILVIARLHSHPNVEAEEYGKEYHWLKSLKERVQPQLKQEWGEEDEYYRNIILYILNNECVGKADKENAINWFKSLKDRVQPKKEWSEEAQQIIKDAACFILSCVNTAETKEEEERLEELADKLQDLRPQKQ